jgi:hypothetical protein
VTTAATVMAVPTFALRAAAMVVVGPASPGKPLLELLPEVLVELLPEVLALPPPELLVVLLLDVLVVLVELLVAAPAPVLSFVVLLLHANRSEDVIDAVAKKVKVSEEGFMGA